MHPDVGDLILGIKRSLMEEILPAVGTAYAREQLAFAALFCDHVAARWDRTHIFVIAEFDDLRTTLATAIASGRGCRPPRAPLTAALDSANAALIATGADTAQPLRVLQRAVAELKACLVRLLEACDDRDATDGEWRAAMRESLRAYMRRQLAREEDWVSTTPIGWW